jgi:hypothetical protein
MKEKSLQYKKNGKKLRAEPVYIKSMDKMLCEKREKKEMKKFETPFSSPKDYICKFPCLLKKCEHQKNLNQATPLFKLTMICTYFQTKKYDILKNLIKRKY